LSQELLDQIKFDAGLSAGDSVFLSCEADGILNKLCAKLRNKIGQDLDLFERDVFKFCWIIDFPFYEWNDERQCLDFSHNPFSMPQGGLDALVNAESVDDLLKITAYQYDIVCNGVELSSGAIRNHKPELMYKAFELVGYSKKEVEEKFSGMLKAFRYGAPPHGGIAPGIDRIVMLLCQEPNIREVITFPLNQQAQDLLMDAPAEVSKKKLEELHIAINYKNN
jgi:aspartyl-tRNA synthetase